jgi:hypothetical protein
MSIVCCSVQTADSDDSSSDWDADFSGSSSEGNWDETLGVEQVSIHLSSLVVDEKMIADV